MELDFPGILWPSRFLELKVQVKAGIPLAMVEAIAPSLPLAIAL
jgi:hypothetical protein